MIDPVAYLADHRGAVTADKLLLGAAALLILGMVGHELFEAGFSSILSTVDPGVEKFTAQMELAVSEEADE